MAIIKINDCFCISYNGCHSKLIVLLDENFTFAFQTKPSITSRRIANYAKCCMDIYKTIEQTQFFLLNQSKIK